MSAGLHLTAAAVPRLHQQRRAAPPRVVHVNFRVDLTAKSSDSHLLQQPWSVCIFTRQQRTNERSQWLPILRITPADADHTPVFVVRQRMRQGSSSDKMERFEHGCSRRCRKAAVAICRAASSVVAREEQPRLNGECGMQQMGVGGCSQGKC